MCFGPVKEKRLFISGGSGERCWVCKLPISFSLYWFCKRIFWTSLENEFNEKIKLQKAVLKKRERSSFSTTTFQFRLFTLSTKSLWIRYCQISCIHYFNNSLKNPLNTYDCTFDGYDFTQLCRLTDQFFSKYFPSNFGLYRPNSNNIPISRAKKLRLR